MESSVLIPMSVSPCATQEPSQANILPPLPIPKPLIYGNIDNALRNLSPRNKQTVYDVIAEEIAKPETTDQLVSGIKKLAHHATSVDGAFVCVRSGLKMLDEQNVTDKGGNPIPKFHSKWIEFQDRWTNLLWESYRTATCAEAYIDEFVTTIIPVVEDVQTNEDRDDAIKDLRRFSERKNAERTRDEATEYSKAFRVLKNEIGDFSIGFEGAIVRVSEVRNESVERLRDLGDEISKCQTIVESFFNCFNEIVDRAGKGIMMALSSFKPALVIKLLVSSLTKAGMGSSLGNYEERDSATLRFTEEKEKLCDLNVLLETLEYSKTYINDISVGLEQFGAVWQFVAHDADMIARELEACVIADWSMKAFKLHVRHLKTGYKGLGYALCQYAIQLGRPDVKKDPANDQKPNNPASPPSYANGSNFQGESKRAVVDELVVKVPRTGDRIDAPQNAKECREAQPHAPIPNRVYASDQILEGRDASGLKLPEADRANGKTTNLPEASSELDIEVRELIECSPLSKYLKKQLKGGLSALAIQGKSNRLNKELNIIVQPEPPARRGVRVFRKFSRILEAANRTHKTHKT